METVNKLLDTAREKCSPATDMALAAELGVTRSAVSNYRHGRAYPDVVVCDALSRMTGQPLARVLGIVGEARALRSAEKQVWRRLATTAVLALSTLALTLPAMPSTAASESASGLYIMRYWRWLRRHFIPTSKCWAAA